MLIEIHMIQNHSPANLNRDDLGAPKTCYFGGVMRARISSQCLKRSIRRSAHFQEALRSQGAIRTRHLIREICKRASKLDEPPKKMLEEISKVFKDGGVNTKEADGDSYATDILWFVPDSAIDELAKAVKDGEDLKESFPSILTEKAAVADIALCGRMTEFEAKKHFSGLNAKLRIEEALYAAHALSTHEVITEVDYFTAVDDLAVGTGAGHINETMFLSACFYKYFSISWDQLLANLSENRELACRTVAQFIRAAALTTPSGKQHAFAAFNLPDGILVEIKEKAIPISYANAFADPVPMKGERSLIAESIARLGQYVGNVNTAYGIDAKRFWFSTNGKPLMWITSVGTGANEETPVIPDKDANVRSLDDLIRCVVNALSCEGGGNGGQS